MAREPNSPYWQRRHDRARLRSARNGKRPGGKPTGMCVEPGCTEYGMACWLPDYSGEGAAAKPDAYYCREHIEHTGFCKGCGSFNGGIESFEFGRHAGFCDICALQIEADERDWNGPDDYDDGYDPYDDDRGTSIVIIGGWPEEVFAT